jgi:hypothetical protein
MGKRVFRSRTLSRSPHRTGQTGREALGSLSTHTAFRKRFLLREPPGSAGGLKASARHFLDSREVVVAQRYQRLSPKVCDEIWVRLRGGHAAKPTARALGLPTSTVRDYLLRCGGIRPVPRRRSPSRLSFAEREEISRGLAAGRSLRAIATKLGRAPSTISREVAAHGGPRRYRAAPADQQAWSQARRPQVCKLATRPALRAIVGEQLKQKWSPEQIAGWLKATYPHDPEMQVSHETIYRTLTQADFDATADQLNGRPRQTLGFKTPSQALAEVLR